MADEPTILGKVIALLEGRAPQRFCDDCIAEALDLSRPSRANRAARELSQRDGFERSRQPCGICGSKRIVIGQIANDRRCEQAAGDDR